MTKLKVFLSNSFDPYLNIAVEEWIFHHLTPDQQVLYLWRNEKTVVIGRNQNPWSECNLEKMKVDGIHLVRRTTGGGAVFHDLGNTNFTFLSPKSGYKRDHNIKVIQGALAEFEIHAQVSGRNDLMVASSDGDRKFSGSAYREKSDRAFHHGTVLLNADLTKLAQYLTPHPKKIKAKGKESVRSRVINLQEIAPEINHEKFIEKAIQSFEQVYGQKADIQELDGKEMEKIPELKAQYENLKSWNWLYGHTLEFNLQIQEYLALGFFDIRFQVEEARIKEIQIFSDCLFPNLIDGLSQALKEKAFNQKSLNEAFSELIIHFPELQKELAELRDWIALQVEV
jgi:lipoate-protein ligase A